MNSAENFRTAFRQHLGDKKYHVFVREWSGRRSNWQDELLEEFFEAHPEHRLPEDQLKRALRICEVHGLDLQQGTAKVAFGCIDYTMDYFDDRERQFPHACLDPVECEDVDQTEASVWYCSECRSVQMRHEKWKPNT